jgi:hypothetical protein
MQRQLIIAVAILLSGSCATSEQGRTLEESAKAGDPMSACQLAVDDLKKCLAARQNWMDHPNMERPQCQIDAVPDEHHAYLVSAIRTLPGGTEREEAGKLALDAVDLIETSLRIDRSIPGTSLFEK